MHDLPRRAQRVYQCVPLPIDIGVTDETFRTADMPLYTPRNLATGEVRKPSDPGRALLTGGRKDIGKFKGPVLRGLAARAPYFHNGMAADLRQAVDLYDTRFSIGSPTGKRPTWSRPSRPSSRRRSAVSSKILGRFPASPSHCHVDRHADAACPT